MAFSELFRLMKPGARAVIVDWAFTEKFDGSNSKHDEIRVRIERGNATPQLMTTEEYVKTVQNAGFEVIEAKDQNATDGHPSTPWYMALQGRDFSISSLARTPAGRVFTAQVTRLLEALKLAPRGISEAARLLNDAADSLVEAGKLEIFTPSFLVHARK